jgi:hypothetical protein
MSLLSVSGEEFLRRLAEGDIPDEWSEDAISRHGAASGNATLQPRRMASRDPGRGGAHVPAAVGYRARR